MNRWRRRPFLAGFVNSGAAALGPRRNEPLAAYAGLLRFADGGLGVGGKNVACLEIGLRLSGHRRNISLMRGIARIQGVKIDGIGIAPLLASARADIEADID